MFDVALKVQGKLKGRLMLHWKYLKIGCNFRDPTHQHPMWFKLRQIPFDFHVALFQTDDSVICKYVTCKWDFINTCYVVELYSCRTAVDSTSLTAEAWHHFLKINHDIIAELTQPRSLGWIGTVQASAFTQRGHVTSLFWDSVDLHSERGKTRLLLLLLL